MNPFEYDSPIKGQDYYNWEDIYPRAYNKRTTSFKEIVEIMI